jgi:ABC-2 type transport system permease protein
MLWYKAWLESRTRFLITAGTLAMFCLFVVLFQNQIQARGSPIPSGLRGHVYSEHIYNLIYSGTAKGIFSILVIFLGLGGLLRERAHGTATFTLALPASRLRLLTAQIGVGLSEMAVLALVPVLLIPGISPLVHQSYPMSQAFQFSILWFGCGTIIFAMAFLLSVLIGGEYTAPVACFILLFFHTVIALWRPLRPYRLNMFWTMGGVGMMHWGLQNTLVLSGPLPWARLLTIALTSIALLAIAAKVAQRQDF